MSILSPIFASRFVSSSSFVNTMHPVPLSPLGLIIFFMGICVLLCLTVPSYI